MKIKLLTSVSIDGIIRKPGDEVEVDRHIALDLISRRRAESLEAPKEAGVITSEALAPEAPKSRRKKADAEGDEAGE
jgi:hypothetical protein